MSKGLDALKEIRKATTHQIDDDCPYPYTVNYYEDEENIIEKELKALETIKEICVIKFNDETQSILIRTPDNVSKTIKLKEKYDLLKEVLL